MKRRVVKVGGSLLAVGELGSKLSTWFAANFDMQNIIVVGGGEFVDLVRMKQQTQSLSDEQSHQLACRSMSLTARIVASLVDAEFHERYEQLADSESAVVVFDSCEWILQQENVPASWDFTSDSIAARLACSLDADELVLIKSRMGLVDEPDFVDACFSAESKSVKSVRVCTLSE